MGRHSWYTYTNAPVDGVTWLAVYVQVKRFCTVCRESEIVSDTRR